MNQETKTCQNCHKNFTIEPEDFKFYEKISVPPPTFCAECRFQRRIAWRNERSLYKDRKCDLCGALVISIYAPNNPAKVYCQNCWWSDKWDAQNSGRDYDFSKTFFEQFRDLVRETPQMSLINKQAVNSPFCHSTVGNKNCYLVFGGDYNEDCMYSTFNFYSKDSLDLYWSFKCERSYELIDARSCYNVSFGHYSENCFDSFLLYDCKNCNNCFGCVGLRNKSYCIFNKQYKKEEYFEKLKELNISSFKNLKKYIGEFQTLVLKYPHRFAVIERSINSTGNNILNSKNCYRCFDIESNIENGRYIWLAFAGPKDINSVCHVSTGTELCYDSCSLVEDSNILFSKKIWNQSRYVQYSYNCHNSSNIFGCTSLRNKQYCILNKQYSKEEYEKLLPKIIAQMSEKKYIDKAGCVYAYGEFFPAEMSPFSYNETVAQEYFPLTKKEAVTRGYNWKDREAKEYKVTLEAEQLTDDIVDVPDSIVNEVIGCDHKETCTENCTRAFRILQSELAFYRSKNLPIPRLCPNCRHYQRIKQRNPLKLWHRQCMCPSNLYQNTIKHDHEGSCPNEFETTYAPERPEIVYCEKCYLKEVV